MGLDISAYSQLFLVTTDVPEDYENDDGLVWIVHIPDGVDRMDGRSAGLYGRIRDVNLWWHAEHDKFQIPDQEVAKLEERIAALRAGAKAACPGDLAVLDEARVTSTYHGFRAGSYSGYNWWREQLCTLALDIAPREVWAEPERFVGRPFVELINFSDAEGAIGPATSAKLARDFATHADALAARASAQIADADSRAYFVDSYAEWQRAFELAAQDGFVILH